MKALPLAAAGLAAVALTGLYVGYGNSDWGVVSEATVSPPVAWANCYPEMRAQVGGTDQPGISPDSALFYHPIVTEVGGERAWDGWLFYGHVTDGDGAEVTFSCATDSTGVPVATT